MSQYMQLKVAMIPEGSLVFMENVPEEMLAEPLMALMGAIRKALVIEGKSKVGNITLTVNAHYTAFVPPKQKKEEVKEVDPADAWKGPLLPVAGERNTYTYPDGTKISLSTIKDEWRVSRPPHNYGMRDIAGNVMYFPTPRHAARECVRRGFGPVSLLPQPEATEPPNENEHETQE